MADDHQQQTYIELKDDEYKGIEFVSQKKPITVNTLNDLTTHFTRGKKRISTKIMPQYQCRRCDRASYIFMFDLIQHSDEQTV